MPKRTGGTNRTCQGDGKLSKNGGAAGGEVEVDPRRIRYQSSKVRPYFSCGRKLVEQLELLRNGDVAVESIPRIHVVFGKERDDDGLWFFGLNNRRL